MITLNTNPGLLRTAVYERILSDLQQGAIAPGETISLNKLAETLKVIRNVFPRVTPEHVARLKDLNARMYPGTQDISNDEYNRINLAFHETYLELETSSLLKKLLRINRLRLFQFSLRDWGKAFCAVNHAEHDRIIELFESGTAEELSRYVTQVHWSFNWQQGTES